MTKKTLYIIRSKRTGSLKIATKKPKLEEDATSIAKVEIIPKIVKKYDKKITARQIYELLRMELFLGNWD